MSTQRNPLFVILIKYITGTNIVAKYYITRGVPAVAAGVTHNIYCLYKFDSALKK
jgi:hypothetical protein